MAPTTWPSTVTCARRQRWTTARIGRLCRNLTRKSPCPRLLAGNPDALSRVEPPITVRAPMRPVLSIAVLVTMLAPALVLGAGCGSEIGDSCAVSLDCDPSNSTDRVCDLSSAGGYCTIMGCD